MRCYALLCYAVRKVAPLAAGVVVSLLPLLLRNVCFTRDESAEKDGTDDSLT